MNDLSPLIFKKFLKKDVRIINYDFKWNINILINKANENSYEIFINIFCYNSIIL